MSLKKSKGWIIILFAVILLIVSVVLFFPGVTDKIITGLAPFDSFSISLSVTHAVIEIDNRTQLDPVVVNGTNITIRAPVTYYANITMNLTLDIPSGFECCHSWYINESGNIKNVTATSINLSWEADKSIKNTSLYFEAPRPTIISEVAYIGDSYYEKTIVIDSCAILINASVNVTINQNYTNYVLYLIENSTLINRTAEYNLQITNGTASFYGFNLSDTDKTFRLTAPPNASIVDKIIYLGNGGGGGGGGGGIPLLNYTPTQQFFVEPNYITVLTAAPGYLVANLTIYNLRGAEKTFTINFTDNFVYAVVANVTIPHQNFTTVPIYMDTSGLGPGTYTDYIYVNDGKYEEKITISLEVLESAGEVTQAEEILPEEEQPAPVSPPPEEDMSRERKRANIMGILLSTIAVMLLVAGVIYLHLREKKEKY